MMKFSDEIALSLILHGRSGTVRLTIEGSGQSTTHNSLGTGKASGTSKKTLAEDQFQLDSPNCQD